MRKLSRVEKFESYIERTFFPLPIQLGEYEVTWVKFCKNHYQDKIKVGAPLLDQMKPIFKTIHGWDPDAVGNENDYLVSLCNSLFDIFLKIKDDQSGNNVLLKEVLSSSFESSYRYPGDSPIERVIHSLVSKISISNYLTRLGNPRYSLEKDIYNR